MLLKLPTPYWKMVNEALISDPVDPLHGLAGLSLLPTTVRVSTDAFVSVDPKDLESIHNFMKSMVTFSFVFLKFIKNSSSFIDILC